MFSRTSQSSKPTIIVYFDHTAKLGGGEISLLNMVSHIDTALYTPVVVLGEEGDLASQLRAANIETHILPLDEQISQTRKDTLDGSMGLRLKQALNALSYVIRLSWFLHRRGAQILHTNSLKADVLGGLAGRLASVPIVWHVRDRIADDYLPPRAAALFRLACRLVPQYLIVNSQATLDALELPSDSSTRVVHDGFVEPRGIARQRLENEPLIGLVGRISPWKGQDVFIRAAAKVREQWPQVRFQIIGSAMFGEDNYEREVRALASELKLDDRLEWLGFRDDVPGLIADLDILAHASTIGEPFGQVVMEGMAAAKPVVATRGGGVVEIIKENETGLLVPMGDSNAMAEALLWLLQHPERALEMGQMGQKRVREHFTIQNTTRKVQALYRHIQDNAPRRARRRAIVWLLLFGLLLLFVQRKR